ncbi:MAG: glycosyltransferase family 2 protein [Actinomycetota bacterium]
MTSNVTAIVISHNQPNLLAEVLSQIEKQTIAPNRTLIVDTSSEPPILDPKWEVMRLPAKSNFAQAVNQAAASVGQSGYLWLLHDDSAPESTALEYLLREVELSPSLAIVGPKQLEWENPQIIQQLGITLTRSGKILNTLKGEFDQGQHDRIQDALAVGTAGALINLEIFEKISGFDVKAPQLASDVDFSLRARLSGARVSVAPDARVRHRMLSLSGERRRAWLGGSVAVAARRAEIHIQLAYAPLVFFLFYYLTLLPASLVGSLWLLLTKRLKAVPTELIAALLSFLSLPALLASRAKIRRTTTAKFASLRGLLASRQEIRNYFRRTREREISNRLIAAHTRGEEVLTERSGIIQSGAIWWALGLVALNLTRIPSGVATTGGGVIPLSGNWLEIFNRAGSSALDFGLGLTVPADPLVWALALISAPFFFEPSLAVTLWLFFAGAISFLGAFKLAQRFVAKNSVAVLVGLSYALWPALALASAETRFTQVLAISLLPWLSLVVSGLVGIGTGPRGATWSRVGLAGILFAIVAAASPVTGVVAGLVLLGLGIVKPKRLIPVMFVPLLALAWWLPLLSQNLHLAKLPNLLRDPGVTQGTNLERDWSFLFFGLNSWNFALLIVIPVLLFALLALLTKKLGTTSGIWAVALVALSGAWISVGVRFDSGDSSVNIDPHALLGLAALMLVLLAGIFLDQFSRLTLVAAIALIGVGILPAAYSLLTNPVNISYSDGRVVPSLIQADSSSNLKTLELSNGKAGISATVFLGDGIHLDELSSSAKAALASASNSTAYQLLGMTVANLAAGNTATKLEDFQNLSIGYILLSPKDRDLQMALDSSPLLESIGETDFGQLWKVKEISTANSQSNWNWEFAKLAQLGTLAFYLLLLMPPSSARRRKESEIFLDVEENN